MKIIDLGVCIDNKDPKGIGRIRVARYADFVSEKKRHNNILHILMMICL